MTGPAYGKIKIPSKVYLVGLKTVEINADVYIHVKGYALARVTHLDIELDGIENLVKGNGEFLTVEGITNGISIVFPNFRQIGIHKVKKMNILSDVLRNLLKPGEKTRCWVGSKLGGIYIGFKKEYINKLEEIAKKLQPELFTQ